MRDVSQDFERSGIQLRMFRAGNGSDLSDPLLQRCWLLPGVTNELAEDGYEDRVRELPVPCENHLEAIH